MPPLHPFRKARDCQMECKSKKCDFCSCENLFINHSRKQNRAFSGYARGWFLTIPCRALLASASAPPLYSRKSRFAAIFREYLVLYNNQMRTRICKNFCFRRKGEAARFCNMRALNYRAARKTPIAPSIARAMGFSSNSRNFLLSAQKKICEPFSLAKNKQLC